MAIEFPPDMIPFLELDDISKTADDIRQKHFGPAIPVDVDLVAERAFDLHLIPVNDLKRQVMFNVNYYCRSTTIVISDRLPL